MDEEEIEKRSSRMPSLIAVNWNDRHRRSPVFGWAADRLFRSGRGPLRLVRRGSEFFTSVKSDMGTNRVYPYSQVPGVNTPGEATTALLARLVELTRAHNPDYDLRASHVVITVPASFSTLARRETLEAAASAGLDMSRVELLDEPVAVRFRTQTTTA